MSDISWEINVSNFCIAFQCKIPRFGEVILQSRVWNRGTQRFTFSLTDENHLYRTVPPVLAMLNLPQQSHSTLSKYRICIPQLINTCLICVVRFGGGFLQSIVLNKCSQHCHVLLDFAQKFTFSLINVNHLYKTPYHKLTMLNILRQPHSILWKYRICISLLIITCLTYSVLLNLARPLK